jgi:hypothetical protein
MDLFSFLSFHFMYVSVTVVTGHSMALSRRSHLFSTMSSLHDILVHNNMPKRTKRPWYTSIARSPACHPSDGTATSGDSEGWEGYSNLQPWIAWAAPECSSAKPPHHVRATKKMNGKKGWWHKERTRYVSKAPWPFAHCSSRKRWSTGVMEAEEAWTMTLWSVPSQIQSLHHKIRAQKHAFVKFAFMYTRAIPPLMAPKSHRWMLHIANPAPLHDLAARNLGRTETLIPSGTLTKKVLQLWK